MPARLKATSTPRTRLRHYSERRLSSVRGPASHPARGPAWDLEALGRVRGSQLSIQENLMQPQDPNTFMRQMCNAYLFIHDVDDVNEDYSKASAVPTLSDTPCLSADPVAIDPAAALDGEFIKHLREPHTRLSRLDQHQIKKSFTGRNTTKSKRKTKKTLKH